MSFEVAQLACHNKGGKLAEPPVSTREAFYKSLKDAFPDEIETGKNYALISIPVTILVVFQLREELWKNEIHS